MVLRPASAGLAGHVERLEQTPAAERQYLTRAEHLDRFGAAPADVALVRRFASDNGLWVAREHRPSRTVELTGTAAQMSAAFGVDLQLFMTPEGVVRGRTGAVSLPPSLAPVVEGVFGLDTRRQAEPHFRVLPGSATDRFSPAASPAGSFTVPQLKQIYRMPAGVNGTGESIAIIELGGGFRQADLDHYFAALNISPSPTVIAVPVGGATNRPTGNPTGPDGEVVLDIEVAGAIAPGAQIVVYFAPNTDQGFLAAVNAAIHDTTHESKVISISWGGPESSWTSQAMQAMNTAFASANALGICVFAAAGDNGSTDGASDGESHADFPASAPSGVACGGTNLQVSGTAITSETVWNAGGGATGGGVSDQFPVPPYQAALNPTSANPNGGHGRGVPDVAADADPATGYQVYIDGQAMVFGGTSAVAPLWAGLVTLVNQASGRSFPPLQSLLYPAPQAFNDITIGNNGAYSAAPGWDPCTGLGSPIGTAVLSALSGAGAPAKPPVAPAAPRNPPT